MSAGDKSQRYLKLVESRKTCNLCTGLTNPAVVAGGSLDSDRIGPYSRWQGNLYSELVVVAQDFADLDTFRAVQGWPGERVGTNTTLVDLVAAAGITIAPPNRGNPEDRLFFTNAVLCLKRGNMQTKIPDDCFRECGKRFLRKTLELVQPRAVAALGEGAVNAVLYAFDLPRVRGITALARSGRTFHLPWGARVFPMCHPSPTVLNTHRSKEEQESDWRRLGQWLGDL